MDLLKSPPTIHLLTDWTCNSGTIKGVVPAIRWDVDERIESFVIWKTVTVTVAMAWEFSAELIVGRVLKFFLVGFSEILEFRITDLTIDVKTQLATVTGVYWLQDLIEKDALVSLTVARRVSFTDADYGITPTSALTTRVDANLPAYWSLDTVTPTGTIDVQYSVATALAAAIAIATAVKRATGTTYEISARPNGTTGLYLSLSVYSAYTVDVRSGKNLIGLQRTQRRAEQSTRVAFSTPDALRQPGYVVSAVSANTYIEVTAIESLGPGPAREDDQFNNFYWWGQDLITSHLITDTVKVSYGTTRFLMTSTTTIAVGDRGYLSADSAGNDPAYVDSPSLQATWGKRIGVLTGDDPYENVVRNCDLRHWTAGVLDSWTTTVVGTSTVVDTTTAGFWRTGGHSARMGNGNTTAVVERTETIYCQVADTVVFSAWLKFVTNYAPFPDDTYVEFLVDGVRVFITVAGTDAWAVGWNRFDYGPFAVAAGSHTFKVKVRAFATADLYFDAAQVLVGGASGAAFRVGSGAADNIAAANAHFETNGAPIATYNLDMVNLEALVDESLLIGIDRPDLGATVYLTDATLGESRTAFRVVQYRHVSERPANPVLQLSTLPRRLTSILAA